MGVHISSLGLVLENILLLRYQSYFVSRSCLLLIHCAWKEMPSSYLGINIGRSLYFRGGAGFCISRNMSRRCLGSQESTLADLRLLFSLRAEPPFQPVPGLQSKRSHHAVSLLKALSLSPPHLFPPLK